MRTVAFHDHIVARRLEKLAGQIDIVHTWPLGAMETLKMARRLGIPTVLERCNAHTGFAMEVVQRECDRLGVTLPPDHEHAYNATKLRKEEEEYELADRLLCPSDFVMRTFLDRGYPAAKLARHQYGFDERTFHASSKPRSASPGLTMLFVGVCAVRKGVHYALEAWLNSPASQAGTFLIAGEFLPDYAQKLKPMLQHPSVKVLGHRNDVPELMRKSDILVLPSIEEGSALVTSEARGSGCVLVVSEAAGAICQHMKNALVHSVGDVAALTQHITKLHEDRGLLERLRTASLATVPELTWTAAGKVLLEVYRETIAAHRAGAPVFPGAALASAIN
jgi:glycosyltransferase involved in cell wall biosynthesis